MSQRSSQHHEPSDEPAATQAWQHGKLSSHDAQPDNTQQPDEQPDDAQQQPEAAAKVFPTGAHAAPQQSAPTLLTQPLEDSFKDEATARARARDRAVVGSPRAAAVMQVILAILAPITLLIAAIRAVASPVFLWFEYNRPGFPDDLYGMDTEQRLTFGSYGLDYLFNLAPPSYLADLQFDDGTPVFTEAEVGHMVDVKILMWAATIAGVVFALVCIILMIMLYRMRKGAIAKSLFAGAMWFTVALIVLAIIGAVAWEAFFTGFHQVFFADGTWTFHTTDTLIRLYPGQFWIDAAAWVAGLTLATMAAIMLFTWPTNRRRYRATQAQKFMESQVVNEHRGKH